MKKVLKVIGLLLLAALAFVLIAGIFVDKDYHFERSITINAPREQVWPHVSSLTAMDKWSPWNEYDPHMQKSLEGTDGTVGAVSSWKGNKDVGSGSQEITAVTPPERIQTKLRFKEPFESEADAGIALRSENNATVVTWSMDSKFMYPLNVCRLFMDMDSMMDKDFSKGLGKLKGLAEGR